jgi:hypothetical protein
MLSKLNMTSVYGWFGGFGEFIVVTSLAAAIALAFLSKLTPSFSCTLTAIGVSGVAHDQMTTWQNNRNTANETTENNIRKG